MDKMAFINDQSVSIPEYLETVDKLITSAPTLKKKTMYWIDRINWMVVSITGEEPQPYYAVIKRWLKEKDQHGIMSISFIYNKLDPLYQRSLLGEHKPLKYIIAAIIKSHARELAELKNKDVKQFRETIY